MKRKLIATSLVSMLLLTGCTSIGATDTQLEQANNVKQEKILTAEKSGILPKYSYDDLLEKSSVIATVQFVETSEPFEIQSTSGSTSIFTDYTMKVVDSIKGKVTPDDEIIVRLEGGQVEDLNVIVRENPELESKTPILLFLYQPGMGGSYNTQGDYYYVLGMNRGAFYSDDKARVVNSEYTNEVGMTINLETLKTDVISLSTLKNADSNNENWVYEEFIENQKKNLESGFITQEEYNQLLEDAQNYAIVVE